MAANENIIRIALMATDKTLGKTLGEAAKKAETFGDKMGRVGDRMSSAGRTMTMGFTVPIVAGLALATKAAMEEDKQMAIMAKTIKNATGATDEQIDATERWISKQEDATAIGDGELRPALMNLVRVTKDMTKAQDLMGVAMDIAAAKGLPVEKVAAAMAKAYDGNVGALSRLGIKTKDAEGKTLSFDAVMKNAVKTFGGSAQEAADTTAGKFDNLKNKIGNIQENLGRVLTPAFEKLVGWLDKIAKAIRDADPFWQNLIVVVALVAAAIGPLLMIGGSLITTFISIQSALALAGLSFTAVLGPIALAVVAVVGVVTALVLLYKKNEEFRNFVQEAWAFINDKISAAATWIGQKLSDLWNWLKKVWEENKKTRDEIATKWAEIKERVSAAVTWITTKLREFIDWVQKTWRENESLRRVVTGAWNLIKAGVSFAISAILKTISGLLTIFLKVIDGAVSVKDKLVGAFNKLKSAMSTIWDGIKGVVRSSKDAIIGFINDIIEAINHIIKVVPGLKNNVDPIPTFGGSRRSGGGSYDSPSRGTSSSGSLPRSGASLPATADNGGTGADPETTSSDSAWGGITDWVKRILDGLGIQWPSMPGGMFGGAGTWILDLAKKAVADLVRKYAWPGYQIIELMKTRIGDPYVWGGQTPGGFDCTGLGYWAYKSMGHPLPARTGWWNYGRQVSGRSLMPGDVMFYYPNVVQDGVRVKYGHVKYYAGDGQTIESASGGVHMHAADWGGMQEARTYLAKGGVYVGEKGPEAVLPLTDKRAMRRLAMAGMGGSVNYTDNSRINIIWQTATGSPTATDVKRLYQQIASIESRAATARRRGSVRG